MSRVELYGWAKHYRIPFGGARKECVALKLLAKIGVKWKVD